jgi:pyroglutamyl-peptidase
MKILVTGFDKFGAHQLNPTERLVAAMTAAAQSGSEEFLSSPHKLRALLLPTEFGGSFSHLEKELERFDPDIVLSLGLAGGRSDSIELERVAINCSDADIADNRGHKPVGEPIVLGGESAFFSTLPIGELRTSLNEAGIPAKISNSAGTYVCNELMYRLLEKTLRSRRRAGFVHVPFLPEQAGGAPSMPFETMVKALKVMLATLASGR